MRHLLRLWSVVVSLTVIENTVGAGKRNAKKDLHHHMTKREVAYFFGVKDHSKIPEYDVVIPLETEPNGRTVSRFRRRKRSVARPDVLHYRLHAFGTRLQLKMKRNKRLMAPNLVVETHHGGGMVTTRPVPKNKFYLGKVSSDLDSLVALRSNRGLTGMIRTFGEVLLVQPLSKHLAKRLRKRSNSVPHLIYKLSASKESKCGSQTEESGKERSINPRKRRSANESSDFRYLEAALIVSQPFVDKYHPNKFSTILLVMANMVAAMFQDPSIGKYPVYYVVNKIFHIQNKRELGFKDTDGISFKLNKISDWSRKFMSKSDTDPEHFDVFSYITDKTGGVSGLAQLFKMCKPGNGNLNQDIGLQTAFAIAHETGHNMNVGHDSPSNCPGGPFIMSSVTPSGVNASRWSSCSRVKFESMLKSRSTWTCLNDVPFDILNYNLSSLYQDKLPGEIFDGNSQCEMMYGDSWTISGYQQWCIGGVCEDNGKKRMPGGWSSWSLSHSTCTRSCGGGVQYRTRSCNNPLPMNDGKPCEGPAKMWRICNLGLCPSSSPTFRAVQCSQRKPGSIPWRPTGCNLYCRIGPSVYPRGIVEDGTRCHSDPSNLDVCIEGQCRRVGCDSVIDSNALVDRCGICGGDGECMAKSKEMYVLFLLSPGPENADLIATLPVGTTDVLFQITKSTQNYLGLQANDGTYLVGGHMPLQTQTVTSAGTTITYKKKNNKPELSFAGPTNAVLKVVLEMRRSNTNGGLSHGRPVLLRIRTRSMRCVTSDDQSPASDKACAGVNKPAAQEQCSPKNCTSKWLTTPWSDCSKSCGNGKQTRSVECVMYVNPTEYVLSNQCSEGNKPVVPDTSKSCNSFVCFPEWDTKEGLNREDCGEPIDPKTLSCYRINERGEKTMVSPIMCRFKPKPTRLPCTTPSTPSSPSNPRPSSTPRSRVSQSTVKKGGHAIQTKCSVLITLLVLLLHITEATTY
ncbi:A disintegrin and metalloproteinase with thrombospondin motifs 18 [Acropora cervicornis]|uniref:A disintegrin and metalloproteinase with thrombospondin motifs 18 n=1 Tax=Acropora cervicornis TaxID=6130 RepID=A0AAD9R5S0_ACRCE|nr:A disintegrin and metalloproteinase with thrombospondin motifs 18 [Acropora cervicornis]